MKIIAADDETSAMNILSRAINDAIPGCELRTFNKAGDAIREVAANGYKPDVAFLDIEMPGMTGLDLAKILKTACPMINIIFCTGFSEYAMEAIALRPSGYIMKPATKDKVLTELENLRNPPERTAHSKPVFVQCFGNFEIFVNGEPLKFARAKSKEMFAFMVDRHGAACTSAEIADALWEDGIYDRSRQKQLSVIRLDMMKSLKEAGIENIVIKKKDVMSVRTDTFDCDHYMAIEGDVVMINKFMGEYMMPYTWAEETNALLTSKYL